MGGGKLVSAVLVVVCVNFVLLVCGGKRVFGRVGCPFVVMCCSKVFLKIPFLEFKRIFRSQCRGKNCGGKGDNGRVEICVK